MAVEIAWDPKNEIAVMWDTTTDQAFGPVFSGPSADTEVEEFLIWLRDQGHRVDDMVPGVVRYERQIGDDPRHWLPLSLSHIVKYWCDLPTLKEQP